MIFMDRHTRTHLTLASRRQYLRAIVMMWLMLTACHTKTRDRNSVTIGALTISGAYLVAPVGDAPAAMYFTVQNSGTTADTLIGIRVPGVKHAELHTEIMSSMPHNTPQTASHNVPPMTMMTMVPTPETPILAGAVLRLMPGGRHVMLMGMQRHFIVGDSTYAEISFRHTGIIRVPVRIIDYTQVDSLVQAMSPLSSINPSLPGLIQDRKIAAAGPIRLFQ
jgi:copper(I)-binding protein